MSYSVVWGGVDATLSEVLLVWNDLLLLKLLLLLHNDEEEEKEATELVDRRSAVVAR